jgi:hypothetical protein
MGLDFEKQFSGLQADMISVCLEYCERKCNQIFVHIICDDGNIFVDFFFCTNGKMQKRWEINNLDVAVSNMRQKEALSIIMQNAKKILELCKTDKKPMPTELKLVYDIEAGRLNADYNYDMVFSLDKSKRIISEEWFCQLANNN